MGIKLDMYGFRRVCSGCKKEGPDALDPEEATSEAVSLGWRKLGSGDALIFCPTCTDAFADRHKRR